MAKGATVLNGEKPMFVQIIGMIEDGILSGAYGEGELIISAPQISRLLSVNPATAQRAIGVLTDRGIIYKKRGAGMERGGMTYANRSPSRPTGGEAHTDLLNLSENPFCGTIVPQ
jgi:DNA-binding transcriptional MocR family regulator